MPSRVIRGNGRVWSEAVRTRAENFAAQASRLCALRANIVSVGPPLFFQGAREARRRPARRRPTRRALNSRRASSPATRPTTREGLAFASEATPPPHALGVPSVRSEPPTPPGATSPIHALPRPRPPRRRDMSGDAPTSGEETQITCKFVTRLPEEYRISPTPFAVPGKLTRYGLSEVINHLLALDPPKPFDFLVDGELVRTSLEKLLLRKGISAESTLDVEYIPAVGPPSPEATGAHEDWVSAVDGGWAPAVATGCYDGAARLYLPSGKLACELTAGDGSAPITAVTLLPPEEGASGCVLVAGGHDGVVRSWSVSEKFKQTAAPRLFVGHAGAVSAVAAAPGGEFFASAGHDRTVRVWRREGGVEEPPTAGETLEKPSRSSSKRRKAADGAAARGGGKPSCLEPPPNPPKR